LSDRQCASGGVPARTRAADVGGRIPQAVPCAVSYQDTFGPVARELRRYQPSVDGPTELVAVAGSNDNGEFAFEEPPPLPDGWAYYIRYRNPSETPNGFLFSFVSNSIREFTPRTNVELPDIDLGDITLDPTRDPRFIQEVRTPMAFNWTPRSVEGDSYRLAMVAAEGEGRFISPPLGNVGAVEFQN
jgi:hypothetical protein